MSSYDSRYKVTPNNINVDSSAIEDPLQIPIHVILILIKYFCWSARFRCHCLSNFYTFWHICIVASNLDNSIFQKGIDLISTKCQYHCCFSSPSWSYDHDSFLIRRVGYQCFCFFNILEQFVYIKIVIHR